MDCKLTLGVLVIGAILAAPAGAQTVNVRSGDTVWKVDSSARAVKGVVGAVAPSVLTVMVDGKEEQWRMTEMRQLWREGDSVRNGALIGAVAGGSAGVVGGLALAAYLGNENPVGGTLAATVVLGAIGGLAAGAGFDALRRGRTLLYEQPGTPITVRPIFSGTRRGVDVAVRF